MGLQCGCCIKSNISNKTQDTGKLILTLSRPAKIELQKNKVFLRTALQLASLYKAQPLSSSWAALSSKSLANTIQDFISVLDHEWNLFSGKNAYLHSISQLRGIHRAWLNSQICAGDIWRLRGLTSSPSPLCLRYSARNVGPDHCAKLETLCCGRWWNMWQNRWRHDTNLTPLNRHLIKYANIDFKIRSSITPIHKTKNLYFWHLILIQAKLQSAQLLSLKASLVFSLCTKMNV